MGSLKKERFEESVYKKNRKIVNRNFIDRLYQMQFHEFNNFSMDLYFEGYGQDFDYYTHHQDNYIWQCDFYQQRQIKDLFLYRICLTIEKTLLAKKKCYLLEHIVNKTILVGKYEQQNLLQIAAFFYDYRVLKHALLYLKDVNYNEIGTPLHQAICSELNKGRYQKVQLLIKNKANVNQSSFNTYPIQLAWEYKQYKIVELLIKSGAKTDILDLRNEITIDENLMTPTKSKLKEQQRFKLINAKLDYLDKKYKNSKVFFAKIQYINHSYKFIESNQQIKEKIIQNKHLQQSILDIISVYFQKKCEKKI